MPGSALACSRNSTPLPGRLARTAAPERRPPAACRIGWSHAAISAHAGRASHPARPRRRKNCPVSCADIAVVVLRPAANLVEADQIRLEPDRSCAAPRARPGSAPDPSARSPARRRAARETSRDACCSAIRSRPSALRSPRRLPRPADADTSAARKFAAPCAPPPGIVPRDSRDRHSPA